MRTALLSVEPGDEFDVRSFHVAEALSAAFRLDLRARSRFDALDLGSIVGKRASLTLTDDTRSRSWTGVVAEASQIAVESHGLSTYALRIVPALWLLTHRRGHRLFQHLSAPDIVTKVLSEWGITPALKLSAAYPKLPLRVQHGESDYDFVRRLLADAGISFSFHTPEGEDTKLVMADAPETATPLPAPIPFRAGSTAAGSPAPFVSSVNLAQSPAPGRVTVRDHDFRRPRHPVHATRPTEAAGAKLERYQYAPGATLAETRSSSEPVADGRGAYRHEDRHAEDVARRRAEGHAANATQARYAAASLELAPGSVFSIAGHPHPELGKPLLVTHSWIEGDVGASGWRAGGTAVPASRPFRPALEAEAASHGDQHDPFQPVAHLGKPRVLGVESAIVTGPAGQDIHTDEHGRVTVKFPWDREGKADETSSPFLRVSQGWAGPGYGAHAVPRVGHEVLVAYHEGNPDHPIVVGRVHNATAPVPYNLPENATRTSIRTSSAAGANEITFDDKSGSELFYEYATMDLHKIVGQDELELTKGSRDVHVGGDLSFNAGGKITLTAKNIVVKGGPNVFLNPPQDPPPAAKPKPLRNQSGSGGAPVAAPPAKKPAPTHGGISAAGRAQMAALERAAAAYASGKPCLGWCLKKVEDYLQEVTYGKIGHGNIPRFPYAHDFADYLNAGDRYKSLGLQKLPITNPYDAPEGSIIVVRAGTPGTHNPVAGDIVVKGPGDHFYNDGEMGYGGPGNFPPGNNYVLGIYAPQ